VKPHAVLDSLKLRRTESQANFVFFDAGRPQVEVVKALAAEGVVVGRTLAPDVTWVRIRYWSTRGKRPGPSGGEAVFKSDSK